MAELKAYHCSLKGCEPGSIVHAFSASKARWIYLLKISDVCPDAKIMDISVRVHGKPVTSEAFKRNAEYRGIPFAYVGMNVEVGGKPGVIVGHNVCANLDVMFEGGQVLNCHPNSEVRYFDREGKEVQCG